MNQIENQFKKDEEQTPTNDQDFNFENEKTNNYIQFLKGKNNI